jgi:hydrogenase-4 component B
VNWVHLGLVAQMVLVVVAVVAATIVSDEHRNLVGGVACGALASIGAFTGALALAGRSGDLVIKTALPWLPLTLEPNRLGGLFILIAGLVGLAGSIFGIGYATGPSASRTGWSALAVFLFGMLLVPAAADALSFLMAWELMALASTVLVLADQGSRPLVRSAALWYSAMTHLSFVLLLAGFAILAAQGGGTSFAQMAHVDSSAIPASVAFVLLTLGFATKAGVVPLHVWLPRAHPEAPSHVSALMSAAMVKMGIYGALLTALRLLPAGPGWWGGLLLALGAVSALYGILQASVTSDLKRLLAYSTSENTGLMFLALGAAMITGSIGLTAASEAALVACLLLAVSHAAFKSTLFFGAGSVLHSTGERDLDRLGGLNTRMPWTSGTFGAAALAAAALPITSGLVAEWVLLQALIHSGAPGNRILAIVMPISVAVVALTAGLALLTFVKAYGVGFLARPRSRGAADAHEATLTMRTSLVAGAVAVVVLGLFAGPVANVLAETVGATTVQRTGLFGLRLVGLGAQINPMALALLTIVLLAPVLLAVALAARGRTRRQTDLVWGSGGVRMSPRMQYTATSYAEPLVRVFDDALQPVRDVEVTPLQESRYLVERVQFRQSVTDVVEQRAYLPLISAARFVGRHAARLQNGSIHRYLGYSFAALIVVLIVVSL